MRASSYAILAYCSLRGASMFFRPDKVYDMFPDVNFEQDSQANEVALAYARGLACLITSGGLLSLGGMRGRLASFALIFLMFAVNHLVDGLPFPPLVPVVATNVVVLLLNVYEMSTGSDKTSIGKLSYAAMQGGFGILFLTEPPFLVQDPFTFAVEGQASLHVGQKLGFAIGMCLCMHACLTLFEAPKGPIAAMAVIWGGLIKMATEMDIPAPAYIAAGMCTSVCIYDFLSAPSKVDKKE